MSVNKLRPREPNPELVQHYIRKFEDVSGKADRELGELFRQLPDNVQYNHILRKVRKLNSYYGTRVWNLEGMAERILTLNIDSKLTKGLPEVVNEIALSPTKDGVIRENYSFASKYCSWHQPDDYPIFDSFVGIILEAYQHWDGFTDLGIENLRNYPIFKEIIFDFQKRYKLQEFSIKDLDKFLWLYGIDYDRENKQVQSQLSNTLQPMRYTLAGRPRSNRDSSTSISAYEEFWSQLIAKCKERNAPGQHLNPNKDSWLTFTIQRFLFGYGYLVGFDKCVLRVNIMGFKEKTHTIFDTFYSQRHEIETEIGAELVWEPLLTSCRIDQVVNRHNIRDRERWPELQESMVTGMIKFVNCFEPRIYKLII
ncbi:MAG: DUF4268 domain-containing protein [Anaerolineae bacterium]|nr:DUF4268 domain-containing protein [Anaerolineae bacterium]